MNRTLLATFVMLAFAVLMLPTVPIFANQASTCVSAGNTGLTALMVAHAGEKITGHVVATGCDVGIYVPPGANWVVIRNANVTGANSHGIFAQDVTGLRIVENVVSGNGVAPNANITDKKAIELSGTSNSTVVSNVVVNNGAIGGIALTDDGPFSPGSLNPGNLSASSGNIVKWNYVNSGTTECGIILAVFNPGAGAWNNRIVDNIVVGNSPSNPGPITGQIVVAADGPNSTVSDTVVRGNTIAGSLLPGIVVHSNSPGDMINNTRITDNMISNNGGYPVGASFTTPNDPINSTGIAVIAEASPGMPNPPMLNNTFIHRNTVINDLFGVWTCQTGNTVIHDLDGNSVTPITSCPAGA